MSTRKIAVSTFWQLLSQVAMAALSILTVKFVAVGLSKELAGNYNSAYGFLQMFGILADFGLYAVALREVTRAEGDERERILGAIIVLRCIVLFLSLGAALLLVWLLPLWQGTPLPLSVTIASLVPFFTLLAGILRTIFQVNYRMHYVFIAEVLQRIVSTGIIGAFILMGVRGSTNLQHLHMFLYAGGIGAFVLFLISYVYADRMVAIRSSVDLVLVRRLATAAAPFGLAYLCTALYRESDMTLIAMLRPDFELQNAYYGFVVRMMGMGFLIPTFLMNSVLPLLKNSGGNRELLGKVLFLLFISGITMSLFAFLWPRPLMQLLTTDAYLETALHPGSDSALLLFATPLFFTGFITYGFYVLLHLHAWRRLVSILLLGAAISLTMNISLIPSLGFVGAAWTSIVVHSVLGGTMLAMSVRAMPITFPPLYIGKILAFAALLAAYLWLLYPLLQSPFMTLLGLVGATAWFSVCVLLTKTHRLLQPSSQG